MRRMRVCPWVDPQPRDFPVSLLEGWGRGPSSQCWTVRLFFRQSSPALNCRTQILVGRDERCFCVRPARTQKNKNKNTRDVFDHGSQEGFAPFPRSLPQSEDRMERHKNSLSAQESRGSNQQNCENGVPPWDLGQATVQGKHLISATQPCESTSCSRTSNRANQSLQLGHEASLMTIQPCTQKTSAESTAQIWTTGMYSQTDGTQSSRSSQAVCEHNTQRQETSPFFTARTRKSQRGSSSRAPTGTSALPHLCRNRSTGALSPKHAPALGCSPFSGRLRNHAS